MNGAAGKKSRTVAICFMVAFVGGCLCGRAQNAPTGEPAFAAAREARWRQDLQFLSAGLKAPGYRIAGGIATRGQKDFSTLYPTFDAEIDSLETDVRDLTDAEVLLRMIRLMASAHVAHNRIEIPAGMGFRDHLPLVLQWFSDGLAVIAATPEYSAALGARVLAIGGEPPERFLLDVAPYASYENQTELRQDAPNLMIAQGVLAHFKMIGPDGRVMLQLERPGGEQFALPVAFAQGKVNEVSMLEELPIPPALHLSHRAAYYWYQYLPESQTLYIQYNRCENDPKQRFGDFARKVLADADNNTVKRVVIDLRRNGGGDAHVFGPLKNGLELRLQRDGTVYVLIGPGTFSSAVDNAVELRRDLSAVLVGEPSGGMPGGYGEVDRLTLPNSRLVVRYTTKHEGAPERGAPTSLLPDVAAPFTISDALAGRDPGLDAAIHDQQGGDGTRKSGK